jgi:hypothetical protein
MLGRDKGNTSPGVQLSTLDDAKANGADGDDGVTEEMAGA